MVRTRKVTQDAREVDKWLDVVRWTRTAGKPPVNASKLGLAVADGIVLVGSDAHFWPNHVTPAFRAFVQMARELQPVAVVMNGDVLDGASISRFSRIQWEERPDLVDEIEECKARLAEIVEATPKAAHIWPLGNHDARFESRLAQVAPEYARVHGVHLKDHFEDWSACWALWINNEVVIKHRFKGGMYCTRNNALHSGKSMVTGHTHSLKVMPLTDYNGTRFGVDTGTLADPSGPQFREYTETSPADWRSGFAVLTFRKGELLWPEVVSIRDRNSFEFRGKVHAIEKARAKRKAS